MGGGFLNSNILGRFARHSTRRLPRRKAGRKPFACQQLESRQMLAVETVWNGFFEDDHSMQNMQSMEIAVEADPLREGNVHVTIRRTDSLQVPWRLELRNTPQGLGFRLGSALEFDPDLDRQTDGIQAFKHISRLTVIGGQGADTIVLDESAYDLAREFVVDAGGGNDRLEHRRNEISSPTKLVDFNLSTGAIEFTFDGESSERRTRVAQTSGFEDVAFYGVNISETLVVRTGSGHADIVHWQPGQFDVHLGPSPELATPLRVSYSRYDQVWLLTAGGADTVTLRDHGYRAGSPEAQGQSLLYHDLHVGTQDENDLVQWNLTGDRSIIEISVDGGAGSQNRLEMRSYRAQVEEYMIDGDSIDYFDALGIENRQRLSNNPPSHGGDIIQFGFPDVRVAPREFAYDDIQQLYLATGGGDDTIVVDERTAGRLPSEVAIDAQDDNDAIELNVISKNPSSHYHVDGGTGTNGLTENVRSILPPVSTSGILGVDQLEVTLAIRGNELSLNYYNPLILAPVGIVPAQDEADATTRYTNIAGLTVLSEENGSLRVSEQNQANLPQHVRILLTGQHGMVVSLPVRLDQTSTHWSVESTTTARSQLNLTTGDNADRVEILPHEANLRSIVNGVESAATRVAFSGVRLEVATQGGDDSVTIRHSAALPPLLLYANQGNDRIELNLTQAGASLDNLRRLDGGEDIHDLLVVRDAPANNLSMAIHDQASTTNAILSHEIEALELYGYDGNDRLTNNTSARAFFDGGDGNDTLTGGSGVDRIFGGDGVDQLFGNSGDDFLFADYDSQFNLYPLSGELLNGGPGNDVLVTRGVDQVITGGGNDAIVDHPIDGPPPPPTNQSGSSNGSGGFGSISNLNGTLSGGAGEFTLVGSTVQLRGNGVAPLSVATLDPSVNSYSLVGASGTN